MGAPNQFSNVGWLPQYQSTWERQEFPNWTSMNNTPSWWQPNPYAVSFSQSRGTPPGTQQEALGLYQQPWRRPRQNSHLTNLYPRSFHDLHAERSYLLATLQHENDKALEILRKVPTLEQGLAQAVTESTVFRRKVKKQIGWLKHRLRETTNQEQRMLARLGQLSHEIQSRERIVSVENELMFLRNGIGGSQVDVRFPQFHPQTCPVSYHQHFPMAWAPMQQQQEGNAAVHWQLGPEVPMRPIETTSYQPTNEEDSLNDAQENDSNSQLAESRSAPRSASLNDADLRILETTTRFSYPFSPGCRRLSLQVISTVPNI